ncbi:hypothetical protein [Streptomyces cahuitamycinicus]|uniref:Uncharacterized protein n=1 Tax=Streptomyces cahuitamycinicus TaxID=2070367 RepID=A0A2N8TPW5_9ACTN|nr:hypothetical protein [Streptomyces cahuitamycinicus]PNG21054.1 hypothetical protein C1J00_16870 [Streptomyces cahuitamycinicus]
MTTTEIEKTDAAPAADGRLTPKGARRLAIVERLAYGAAGTWAAAGPIMEVPWWAHGATVAAGALTGWRLWRHTRVDDGPGLLVSTYRSLPVLGWSGSYTAGLLAPHLHYPNGWPMLAAATWTSAMAWAVPLTRSLGLRRIVEQLPEQGAVLDTVQGQVEPVPSTYIGHLKQMWALSSETGDTTLEKIHQFQPDEPDFECYILAPPGQAVPSSVSRRNVAAVFDVPEAAVDIAPVDGYGPGRLYLRVAPNKAKREAETRSAQEGLVQLWAERVSGPGGAAPGMNLIDFKVSDERDRVRILVEAEDSELINLPRLKLARALQMDDPELLMIETDGLGRGVVTIYAEHPLINIREATAEDLTMGPDGLVTVGLRHDGRPFKMPLYDPEMGALTDLAVGAMGSGKSVFLLTVLIAERLSGVISLVADAQSGMSLPEAKGRVYHFGAGVAAMGATLAAACAVADYREQVSSAKGWGSFKLNEPWRLANVTLDEINMVLGEQALVPSEFRKWITGMIARLQQTGRKFGFGIRFAGQSIHVTDLGDAEKIRANAKQGTVWMGRVNSTMTQSMAADMVTDGTEITPIRRFFGSISEELEAAWDGRDVPPGPITAGMAWGLQGGRAILMRVFKALKKDRTYPHLIKLFETQPVIPGFTPEEDRIFQAAYAQALADAERFLAGEEDSDDDEDEEGGSRRRKKKTKKSVTSTPTVTAAPKTLRDKILDALDDGEVHLTRDIRRAVGVGTEDGPAAGSVDTALGRLGSEGLIVSTGHGKWQLVQDQSDEDPES